MIGVVVWCAGMGAYSLIYGLMRWGFGYEWHEFGVPWMLITGALWTVLSCVVGLSGVT